MPISETGTATLGISVVRGASQKHEHHQDHQQHGNDQRHFDIAHRRADGHGLILGDVQLDGLRNGGLELRQRRADAIHCVDDVRARLPVDGDIHRAACRWRAPMLRRSSTESTTSATSRQPHGRAVVVGDDQRPVILGLEHLIVGADFPEVESVRKMSFGNVRVGVVQNAAHLLQADAVLVQRHGIQLHAHARQRAALRVYLSHASDLRKLLRHDGGRGIVQLAAIQHVRGQRELKDWRSAGFTLR